MMITMVNVEEGVEESVEEALANVHVAVSPT